MKPSYLNDFLSVKPESKPVLKSLNYFTVVCCIIYPVFCWYSGLLSFSLFSFITSLVIELLAILTSVFFHFGKFSAGAFTIYFLFPFAVWYKAAYEPLVAVMLFMLAFGISASLSLQRKPAIYLVALVATIGYMLNTYFYESKYSTIFNTHAVSILFIYLLFPLVIYLNLKIIRDALDNFEASLKEKNNELQKQNLVLENQNEEILNQSHQIILRQKLLDEASLFSGKVGMILSHDVRMPLKALENIFNSYNEGMITKEDLAGMAPAIEKDVKYVNSIFIDILELVKEQKKEKQLRMESFRLSVYATEICDAYYSLAKKKHIVISSEVQSDENVYFNVKYFKIIIRNLLANALKFTPVNGKIKIYTIKEDYNKIRIIVADNGIGISKENLAKLKRGIEMRIGNEAGQNSMGVGLAFCNDLLKSGSSVLHIESEEGKGSKFSFLLPLAVTQKELA